MIFQKQTTFIPEGRKWYGPVIAGVSTFSKNCCSINTFKGVFSILEKLEPDPYAKFNEDLYQIGIERFDEDWYYADILTVLYGICKKIRVESYLEIGVRRGRSMAIVASLSPEAKIVGFDNWTVDYGGTENPGPDFVQNEMMKVGYNKHSILISGDSRTTVPQYFEEHKEEFFDLVTIDGDHSEEGASIDVQNVVPRLKIGGFMVFDDVCFTQLSQVWEKIISSGQFNCWSFKEIGYGVAFAIKLR